MHAKKEIDEEMLSSWLRLSTILNNDRLVSDMPYNEALICHLLMANDQPEPLTATDLCKQTHMLKSQMNRTLMEMEKKQLITRERSSKDKRHIWICLNGQKMDAYLHQHEKILNLIHALLDKFNEETVQEIIRIFNMVSQTAEEVIQ